MDDDVRKLALQAHDDMTRLGVLGVEATLLGRGPVSLAEGEAAHRDAASKSNLAPNAIADRIRTLMAAQ